MPDAISNPFFEKYLMGQTGARNLLTSPLTTSFQDWTAGNAMRAQLPAGPPVASGGTQGTGGNPSAGQPGSAGDPGYAKTAADALTGLAMGFGPLGAVGSLMGTIGGQLSNSPSVLGSIAQALGITSASQPQGLSPSAVTNSSTIANMSTDPSAYGLANAAVSTTGQMTQGESPQLQGGFGAGSGFGGTSGTGGVGSTGSAGANATGATGGFGASGFGTAGATGDTAGDIGNTGAGGGAGADTGGGGGTIGGGGGGAQGAGGPYAKGGLIRGPAPRDPSKDNMLIGAQGKEYMLPRHAVELVGIDNLEQIRKIANSAAPDHMKHSAIHAVLKRIANAGTAHPDGVYGTRGLVHPLEPAEKNPFEIAA